MDPKIKPWKAWTWIAFTFILISCAYNSANVWHFLGGTEASDAYWDFQAYLVYSSRLWWALTVLVWVPISWPSLLIKYLALAATVSLIIDMLDLIFSGDYNPNWLDTAFWFAGVPYSLVSYRVYRLSLVSDPIEEGGIYIVSNAPRDIIQLAASFTPWGRGRGNVAIWYDGGYYFANTDTNRYERHDLSRLMLREGQVVKRLDVDPDRLRAWWDHWEGVEYSWDRNCFRVVGELAHRHTHQEPRSNQ